MGRPALSATRATIVLDLLAAYPDRAFTMAEIIKATKINIGSCHALLGALVSRGYLARDDEEKRYTLGLALVNVGRAALQANPLTVRAQAAAEALSARLGVGVQLTTNSGSEIVALSSLAGRNGRFPGLQPGQRFPLAAPAGAHIVAWSTDDEIEEWMTRAGKPTKEEIVTWHENLSLIRSRGYQVTLRVPVSDKYNQLIAQLATNTPNLKFTAQASEFIHAHAWHLDQPGVIDPQCKYEVGLIAAPIFGTSGGARLSLGLGGFSQPLSGEEIVKLADELMHACVEVMSDNMKANESIPSI